MGIIYDGINQYPTDKPYDVVRVVPPGKVVYKLGEPSKVLFPNQKTATKYGYKVNSEDAKWVLEDIDVYLQQYGNLLPEEIKKKITHTVSTKPSKEKIETEKQKKKVQKKIKKVIDTANELSKKEEDIEIDLSELDKEEKKEKPRDIELELEDLDEITSKKEEELDLDLEGLTETPQEVEIDLDGLTTEFEEEEKEFELDLEEVTEKKEEPFELDLSELDKEDEEVDLESLEEEPLTLDFPPGEADTRVEDLDDVKESEEKEPETTESETKFTKLSEEEIERLIEEDLAKLKKQIEEEESKDKADIETESTESVDITEEKIEKEEETKTEEEAEKEEETKEEEEKIEKEEEPSIDIEEVKRKLLESLEEKRKELEHALADYQEGSLEADELNKLFDEFLELKNLVDDYDLSWLDELPEFKEYKLKKEQEKIEEELKKIDEELSQFNEKEVEFVQKLVEANQVDGEESLHKLQEAEEILNKAITELQRNLIEISGVKTRDNKLVEDLYVYWKTHVLGARSKQERIEAQKNLLMFIAQAYINLQLSKGLASDINLSSSSYLNTLLHSPDFFLFFQKITKESLDNTKFLEKLLFFHAYEFGDIADEDTRKQITEMFAKQMKEFFEKIKETDDFTFLTAQAAFNLSMFINTNKENLDICQTLHRIRYTSFPFYKQREEDIGKRVYRKLELTNKAQEIYNLLQQLENQGLADIGEEEIEISDILRKKIEDEKNKLVLSGFSENVANTVYNPEDVYSVTRNLLYYFPNSDLLFKGISATILTRNQDGSYSISNNVNDISTILNAVELVYFQFFEKIKSSIESATEEEVSDIATTAKTHILQSAFLQTGEKNLFAEAVSGMALHLLLKEVSMNKDLSVEELRKTIIKKFLVDSETNMDSLASIEQQLSNASLNAILYDKKSTDVAYGNIDLKIKDIGSLEEAEIGEIRYGALLLRQYAATLMLLGVLGNEETAKTLLEKVKEAAENTSAANFSWTELSKMFLPETSLTATTTFRNIRSFSGLEESAKDLLIDILNKVASSSGFTVQERNIDNIPQLDISITTNSTEEGYAYPIIAKITESFVKKPVLLDEEERKNFVRNGLEYIDTTNEPVDISNTITENLDEEIPQNLDDLSIQFANSVTQDTIDAYNAQFSEFKSSEINLLELQDIHILEEPYSLVLSRDENGNIQTSIIQLGEDRYNIQIPQEDLQKINNIEEFLVYIKNRLFEELFYYGTDQEETDEEKEELINDIIDNLEEAEKESEEEPEQSDLEELEKRIKKFSTEEETEEKSKELEQPFQQLKTIGVSTDSIPEFIKRLDIYNPALFAASDEDKKMFYDYLDSSISSLPSKDKKEILKLLYSIYFPEFLFGADSSGISVKEDSDFYKVISEELLKLRPRKQYNIQVSPEEFGIGGIGRQFTVDINTGLSFAQILKEKGIKLNKNNQRLFSRDLVKFTIKVKGKSPKHIIVPRRYLHDLKDSKKLKAFIESAFASVVFDRKFTEDASKKEKIRDEQLVEVARKKVEEIQNSPEKQEELQQKSKQKQKKSEEKKLRKKKVINEQQEQERKLKELEQSIQQKNEDSERIVTSSEKQEEFIKTVNTEEKLQEFLKDRIYPAIDLAVKQKKSSTISTPIHVDNGIFLCRANVQEAEIKPILDTVTKEVKPKLVVPITFTYSQPNNSRVYTSFSTQLVVDKDSITIPEQELAKLSETALKKFKSFYESEKTKVKLLKRLEKKDETPTSLSSPHYKEIEIPDKDVVIRHTPDGLEIKSSKKDKKTSVKIPNDLAATLTDSNIEELVDDVAQRSAQLSDYNDFQFYDNVYYTFQIFGKKDDKPANVVINKDNGVYSYKIIDNTGNVVYTRTLSSLPSEEKMKEIAKEDLIFLAMNEIEKNNSQSTSETPIETSSSAETTTIEQSPSPKQKQRSNKKAKQTKKVSTEVKEKPKTKKTKKDVSQETQPIQTELQQEPPQTVLLENKQEQPIEQEVSPNISIGDIANIEAVIPPARSLVSDIGYILHSDDNYSAIPLGKYGKLTITKKNLGIVNELVVELNDGNSTTRVFSGYAEQYEDALESLAEEIRENLKEILKTKQ